MGDIYILMLVALTALAVIDLVVGVSNDAVNFLNSALGSKAVSPKTLMIIASLGIFFGAVFSSGMMEVARKGIFIPGEFYFNEIMIIFMAVMVTDVILLDLFNSLGMPTSTTVSIVFELLGAAVAMALVKIGANSEQTISDLGIYINSESALLIISGILLSVVIAFSIGAIVQYISRLLFSFHYEKRMKHFGAIFGGVALTAITYFIFMKGLKGTPFYGNVENILKGNEVYIMAGSFVFWALVSQIYTSLFKKNILVLIIIIGTFGLALAFAGNDLVNFIGVPMAALHSYDAWAASGVPATEFSMGVLAKKVPTESTLLFIAGAIMVVTLWFSKKAKSVTETEIGLARQGDGHEKFKPNYVSRFIVRGTVNLSKVLGYVLPASFIEKIDQQFLKPVIELPKDKSYEVPAFDMIRASVNLMVAGILISIATSFKLPLSTTYVTFMVAMGTSLADRAWDRESAVYRVAGVVNVILGWFSTALIAFTAAALFAYLMYLGGAPIIALLLCLVIFLLIKSYLNHSKKLKEKKETQRLKRAEIVTINEVIEDSSGHISEVIKRVDKLYTNVVTDLSRHDLNKLSKTDKHVKKLKNEVNDLKSNIFYFIKSLDESLVKASRFYLSVLDYLQDITQSIEFISTTSFNHVNNNHKNLKKSQIKDLVEINNKLQETFQLIITGFENRDFTNFVSILEDKQQLLNHVSDSIDTQISRIRTEETSPKNTTLYFGILLETKDLIEATMSLIQLFQEFESSEA
ncbi:inorganic phosphate transporter [Lutibacter sp. TH_r2]|uniref:inorganic phosphate transporter n=1 Tax=Lutibacter sp. TH_r2 TaxID=3082083 RepID=UPI002954B52B|nr:inorganic phosphate transporter [Lutibacter sp. TH_r2]MDV7186650.1 inorganic phosphate transporter [Lutibacter sp. TH_r2]